MAQPPKPKPKIDSTTLIIYCIIGVVVLIGCTLLGGAMDRSLDQAGHVDISQLSKGFNYVASHPSFIVSRLTNKNSYVPKMLFFGASVIGIYALYKYSEDKKRLHRRGTEHGSAKWGDAKEMKQLADLTPPKMHPIKIYDAQSPDGHRVYDEKGNFMGVMIDNIILFTKEVFLSLNAKQHLLNFNVLIIGGSGSGKTRFFAKPNIMQLNTSYVITDPKGELLKSCGEMLRAAGYKVRVFNTIQMNHSNNYNPFHYVYDEHGQVSEDSVKKMVDVLFKATKSDGEKEDFWSQKGQSMLEALVYLLFEESEYNAKRDKNGLIIPETRDESHLNFFSVTEKMRKLQYPPRGSQLPDGFFLTKMPDESDADFEARRAKAFLCPLDKDFLELEKRKPDSLAYRMYKEVRNAPEETGQSFLSSANVKTFFFNLTNLRNLTCCDNIHLETLGDEKTSLFIIISATNSTYNFMASMMYTQLFDTLANRANFVHKGVLPVHVRCIMDEFANIGQIPDFDKVIAFVRSMGMSLNVIIQNIAQLKARYEKTWEVITGNCDTTIFLGGKEESTLKSLSEQLGKETIDVHGTNRTKGKQSSTSENNSILGRELMQPNELSTMPISDCIVMVRSHNPFYCTKYPIEKHPNYAFLGDAGKILPPFDVATVHAVTIEEFTAAHQKVDTNVNSSEAASEHAEPEKESEKIASFFRRSDAIQVSADQVLPLSYEEAAELLQQTGQQEAEGDDEVQYNKSHPEFSVPEAWESADLGEPVKEREEVELDEPVGISAIAEHSDTQHYDVPDEELFVAPDLNEGDVFGVTTVTSEHSPSTYVFAHDADYFDQEDMIEFMS